MSEIILHIATREAWKEARSRNSYVTESLETEKFIRFSTPAQVIAVADFIYRGQRNLVPLCVAPEKLSAELKYEALTTGDV